MEWRGGHMRVGLLLFLFALGAQAFQDARFEQPRAQLFTFAGFGPLADWKVLDFGPATQAISTKAGFLLASPGYGVFATDARGQAFSRVDQSLGLPSASNLRLSSHPLNPDQFAAATPTALYRCHIGARCSLFSYSFGTGPIVDLTFGLGDSVWITTAKDLFYVDERNEVQSFNLTEWNETITAIAYDHSTGAFYVGTTARLWRYDGADKWHFFWVGGLIDATPVALTFDKDGTLWIPNSICINKLSRDLVFSRVGHNQGLVTSNLTCSAVSTKSGAVWIGALNGTMRYFGGRREGPARFQPDWKYYYGPRWLPWPLFSSGQSIVSIATTLNNAGDESTLIVTPTGISLITIESWTLADKAEFYQRMIVPRHDRFGLVEGCSLRSWGNVSSWVGGPDDNSGLWTSIYVVSQCFRYAVTKDPEVKRQAWKHFEAMEFLNNVTGIKGLMARTVLHQDNPPDAQWHRSTAYPGWVWKGDTSSDEVVGHMFAYPMVYDLLAETPDEKARARNLINNIVGYIVENGFVLIDVTGKPTTWGIWAPDLLNGDQNWYSERGLNSFQILSWLLSAARVTGDPKFTKAYKYLVDVHDYSLNVMNLKITDPPDVNYSDDELTFLPYFVYIWTNAFELQREFNVSISRTWNFVREGRPSLWNFIYGSWLLQQQQLLQHQLRSNDETTSAASDAAIDGDKFDLDASVWMLQSYPLSQVDWPVRNQDRHDLHTRGLNRDNRPDYAPPVLPYDEISFDRWNTDPFEYGGGSGWGEADPSAWLLPFWMARYFAFIN